MPRDQSGNYTLPDVYEAETGQTVEAEQHNTPLEDIEQALTGSLPVNGTKAMTGNLPMGGKKITGLADGSDPQDAVTKSQLDTVAGSGLAVTTTGDQTISGVKTFQSIPVGPASNPTTDNQLTRKAFVVAVTGDQTVGGVKTFTDIPVAPSSNPTTANQLTRKAYVDAEVATRAPVVTSSSDFPVGTLILAKIADGAPAVANGGSISGSLLHRAQINESHLVGQGITLSGTWKNVSGETIEEGTSRQGGYFVRTA